MSPSQEEWKPFLNPRGPIRIEHEDGTLVTYGARGLLRGVRGGQKATEPADMELALSEATGTPGRAIPGDKVIRIEEGGPVIVVVVDDDVEPDPGATAITRGNNPPKSFCGLATSGPIRRLLEGWSDRAGAPTPSLYLNPPRGARRSRLSPSDGVSREHDEHGQRGACRHRG